MIIYNKNEIYPNEIAFLFIYSKNNAAKLKEKSKKDQINELAAEGATTSNLYFT